MSELGKKIKNVRIKRGLSQDELAELAKVNLRTIQRIENNETAPREKTLKLIFDALDIELIERDRVTIDKYLLWSSFLTLLVIIGSLLYWTKWFKYFHNGESIYRYYTGWKGVSPFFDYDFPNWLISISTISIGCVVVSHSLGLIKNKKRYVIIQFVLLIFFLLGLFNYSFAQGFDVGPGLFIVSVATILLINAYRKKGRKKEK